MAADSTIDLIINQKASFEVTLLVKDSANAALDLTGYTVAAKYKKDFQTDDADALSFTSSVANAALGSVVISLSPTQTANMEIGKYVYDVTITAPSTFKIRIVEGFIKVSGGVS